MLLVLRNLEYTEQNKHIYDRSDVYIMPWQHSGGTQLNKTKNVREYHSEKITFEISSESVSSHSH